MREFHITEGHWTRETWSV